MRALKVGDMMTERVIAVPLNSDLAAAREAMLEHRIRHLPVLDGDGELVGLVSQRDLLTRTLAPGETMSPDLERQHFAEVAVWEVMTGAVETVDAETPASEAARIMFENKWGCLPVVEGRRLVGILTEADFVRWHAEERQLAG